MYSCPVLSPNLRVGQKTNRGIYPTYLLWFDEFKESSNIEIKTTSTATKNQCLMAKISIEYASQNDEI